jgi:hypothetical protein
MIKAKIFIKIVLPLLILFLASCEGSTSREWIVSNESSTTIKVEATLTHETDTVYKIIASGEKKIITITTEDKGNSLPQQAYDVFTYFLITNADGESTDMQYADNDSWDIYIEETKNNPPHFEMTYTMVVTDGDFE